jgi:ATP adenylyltransferase
VSICRCVGSSECPAKHTNGLSTRAHSNYIHLIPRAKPAFPLSESDDSVVEVNSLGYAGMVLVKDEEELAAVEAATSDEGFMQVLKTCGVPREWGHKQEEEEGALASQSVGH